MNKTAIISNISGTSGSRLDSTIGYLLPQGRIDLFADAFLELVDNAEEGTSMGKEAREQGMERFSLDNSIRSGVKVMKEEPHQ